MVGSIPHRSVGAALLAVWGAVALLALPLALKTSAGPLVLVAVMVVGGLLGGLVTGATVQLPPGPASVAAAIAVLLLGGLREDPDLLRVAGSAALAGAAAALGAHGGHRLRTRPHRLLAGLIAAGTMMVVETVQRNLVEAGLMTDHSTLSLFASMVLGGAAAAALVRDLQPRHAALGAGGVMAVLGGVIALATSSLHILTAIAVLVPVAAGLAAAGFLLVRVGFGLGRTPADEQLPPARTVDRA